MKKELVIYLDILGVLMPKTSNSTLEGKSVYDIHSMVNKNALSVLNLICKANFSKDFDVSIVLTSKFRDNHSPEDISILFDKLNLKLYDILQDDVETMRILNRPYNQVPEGKSIGAHVMKHNVEHYIILSCKPYDEYNSNDQKRFMRVDYSKGLLIDDYFGIIDMIDLHS